MEMLESRINSVELCELINQLRKEEKGEGAKVLLHKSLMEKIRKELETMEKLGITNGQNILLVEYTDKKGETRPCFSLNASGMRQILNSESVYVRCKTEEYITKLEEKNKQLQQSAKTPDLMIAEAIKTMVDTQAKQNEQIIKLIENQNKLTEQVKNITENYQMLCVLTDGQWESKKRISSSNGGLQKISEIVEGTGITPADANKKLIEKGILYEDKIKGKVPTPESIEKGICEELPVRANPGKYFAVYTTKGQKIVREILGIEEVEQTSFDNVINFKK
jgi:hypothetical protein